MAKLKKQEIREDKIGEAVGKAWEYTRTHLEIVGGGGLAVIIIIMAVVLYLQTQTRAEADSLLPFDNAQGMYLQATNAQDLQKAIAQFEAIAKRWGNTSSGRQALLYLGLSYRRLGDYDKAISYFQSFVAKGERNDVLKAAGEEGLAASYEDRGNLQGAAKAYSEMARQFVRDSLVAPRALLAAGRCYEGLKDYASARKAYQEILDRYPTSARNYDAKVALAMLPQ
jgi:TolA-binding protein